MIKNILISAFVMLNTQSCSQKKETMINQNPTITADNIVEEITKQIKHYPSEKIYKLNYTNQDCYFKLYVNDMIIGRQFITSQGGTAIEINNVINKKGKYKVRYELFPVTSENKNTLNEDTNFLLSLDSYDLKNENASDIEYINYEVPKTDEKVTESYSKYKFIGTGKSNYENSFDVEIDIPYSLNFPFENAQDLRKMDKKQLEVKLLKKYKEVAGIYQNKDLDNIAKLVYNNLSNQFISTYATKNQIQDAWDEINEILIKSDNEILPIKEYKIEYFSNGKLVALFTNDTNSKTRGGNALICNVKSGNHGKGLIELKHFFYIPQGETEFKVY